jgi:hypothetical protein
MRFLERNLHCQRPIRKTVSNWKFTPDLAEHFRQKIRVAKKASWETHTQSLDTISVWKTIKQLNSGTTQQRTVPELKDGGKSAKSVEEKLNVLTEKFFPNSVVGDTVSRWTLSPTSCYMKSMVK